MRISAIIAVCIVKLVCTTIQAEQQQTWNQWRGPGRDSQVSVEQTWPESLAEDRLVQLWQVPLGPSYSGPVVTTDHVFTTETKDKKSEVTYAFDRQTGGKLWETEWEGAMQVPFFANANGSWIRATPACDGQRLFVAGIRDVLVCMDARNGDEIWRIDFVEKYGTPLPAFGFASSPLITGDSLYVQAGQSLVKIAASTGNIIWRTADDAASGFNSPFSSPVLTKINGREILLLQTRTALKGIEPVSGEELWSQDIEAFRGMNILTPLVYQDRVFTSAHSGRSQLWNVPTRADQTEVSEAWSNKTQAYMSSPVIVDGHLYLHLRNQRLSCIELETGEEKWRTKPYGKYWSMVAQGDKILALDERGELHLIRANSEEFELLDSRQVSESSTWAHLAVSGGELFIRALDGLAAYRWQ